jgi:hypothetical protein
VVSTFFASKISVQPDEQVSNVLFALLLSVVAIWMLVSIRHEGPEPCLPSDDG